MKPAVASNALDDAIVSGALTQLEFVEWCAREVVCDVVLDTRHFPRSDEDYLAQIKKLATDLGTTLVALRDDALCDRDENGVESIFRMALALGTPLIATTLPPELDTAWIDQLVRIGNAARTGKRYNVTVALRNTAQTRAESVQSCKQVVKETDSAWLRFGPRLNAFSASDDPVALAEKTVLLWSDLANDPNVEIAHIRRVMPTYHGYLALDGQLDPAAAALNARAWIQALSAERA